MVPNSGVGWIKSAGWSNSGVGWIKSVGWSLIAV